MLGGKAGRVVTDLNAEEFPSNTMTKMARKVACPGGRECLYRCRTGIVDKLREERTPSATTRDCFVGEDSEDLGVRAIRRGQRKKIFQP